MTDQQPTASSEDSDRAPASTSKPDSRLDMDAKLAAEIEDALGDMSIEEMMAPSTSAPSPAKRSSSGGSARSSGGGGGGRGSHDGGRQRKTGRVMQIHGNNVFVEFGPRSQGVCPLAQFESTPALGEQLEFIVERFDKEDGLLILSRQGSVQKAEWENLEVGQVVEARCTGVNKGGLEMEVANHRAFMPAGHVDLRHIAELNVFVGEKMPCEIIEIDKSRGKIVLSRKQVQQTERAHLRTTLLGTLEVGQTMPAVIVSIRPFGAFADLGGMDGLIHISDMSYSRIKDPSEVVKEGDQVTVKILKIDRSQDPPKLSLGLKQTQDDPAMATLASLKEGDTVSGRVTRLMPFGAFVELGPGVEGLIHISEMAHERVHDPKRIVKPNEIVTVKVLKVDAEGKKISLSLKAMKSKEDREMEMERKEDARMKNLRAQLNRKFGAIPLKGGLG